MLSDWLVRSIGAPAKKTIPKTTTIISEREVVELECCGQKMRKRKRRKRRKPADGESALIANDELRIKKMRNTRLEVANDNRKRHKRLIQRLTPVSGMFHLGLTAFVVLAAILLGPWTSGASDIVGNQMAADNQTAKLQPPSPFMGQQSAQVSSNMSALMSSTQAQMMSNNSSLVSQMSQIERQHSQNVDQLANQTNLESMQARASQTATNTSINSAQMGPRAATKGGSAHSASNRSQQQVAPQSANSPAYNSRQKTSPAGSSSQHFRGEQQSSRQQRLGAQLDNQMAADDMHETQAFVGSSGATRQRQSQEEESRLRDSDANRQQPSSLASLNDLQRPQAMAMSSGSKPIAMGTSGTSKQQATKSSPPSQTSNAEGWQVVSTSVPNSSSTSSSSVTSANSATWLPKPRGQSGQKQLPPPPPPINYNNFYRQQQHLMDQMSASVFQQQQQQQQQSALAADQLEGTQLERPSSGYSYGTPAYTHTAQLAPARQEVEAANEQQRLTRQRQRQFVLPVDQLSRSSSSMSGHLEQQQISTPRLAPSQLPQFHSSVHYSQQPMGSTTSQAHKQQHVQLAMMAPPQPPVTGTHSSPCKPPPLLQLGLQQQQLQEQLLLANDLAGAASSQQTTPNGLPRYLRFGEGTRLRSQYIFKVLRADSLTDCELACARASLVAGGNPLDTCRSFNYRAYFAAENCELSRTDARQLKLDDATQFEQHTQFDFYALASESSSSPAGQSLQLAQLQQAPIVQQQVAAPYTPAAPDQADCLDVSQSCSQEGMEFTLRTMEPFMGRIYTYGFYESCYLDGEGQTSNTLRISRSNGFPRCGTQQIGDLMTNIVVVQFNDHVQTTRDKKYNLTCYFSGPGEAVVTSSYFDTKLDERSHPMQIEHLPPQNVITSNVQLRILHHGTPTNTIAVGDLLTFRLETQSTGGGGGNSNSGPGSSSSGVKQGRAQQERQHEIFATNVIAKDPYSGRQVQLIDGRGCPVDPVNVFPELQRTTDGALESEFYAFKMPDSNFLIFQATVRACKSPCEPVICHRTGSSGTIPMVGGNSLQQYQMAASNGIKGAGGGGQQQQLGAYLMAATQQNAVPSWGRRRRRKRQSSEASAQSLQADEADEPGDDELIGTGESVEHVIPVRLVGGGSGHQHAGRGSERPPAVITRIKRPELSEAEEEVKEMFRVYLTRAEINNKRRLAQQQQLRELELTADGSAGSPHSGSLVSATTNNSTASQSWNSFEESDTSATELSSQVCLTQVGYYVMLFSIISLSLVVLSVLTIALYITKKAKFHISETLADAMF